MTEKKSSSKPEKKPQRAYSRYVQDPVFIMLTILCILLAMTTIIFASGATCSSGVADDKDDMNDTGTTTPVDTGIDTTKLIIYEFSEFKCPYCSAAAGLNPALENNFKSQMPDWTPAVPGIKENYPDDVQIVFKNFLVHDSAQKSAEASECARDQGMFWEMHDVMFENTANLESSDLKGYAADIGLDTDKFDQCLDSGEKVSTVLDDTNLGKALGVSGTPTFVIGINPDDEELGDLLYSEERGAVNVYEKGTVVIGAHPYSTLEKYIKLELDPTGKADAAAAFAAQQANAATAKADALEIVTGDNKPQIDFFVMSYCPYGNVAEEAIEPVFQTLGDKAIFVPRYIFSKTSNGYNSLHGVQEFNQDIRELCVFNDLGTEAYFEYVLAMNDACSSSNADTCWTAVAEGLGYDTAAIAQCEADEVAEIADAEIAVLGVTGVTGSPTVFIDGQKYNGPRTAQGYLEGLCAAFDTPPAECDSVLSDVQAGASGNC